MLSKIIGELAVASLGPGASDLEKQNARTASETSLKNILRPSARPQESKLKDNNLNLLLKEL
jgi:hypothetical protein